MAVEVDAPAARLRRPGQIRPRHRPAGCSSTVLGPGRGSQGGITINPLTSGGGGKYGVNLEWTSSGGLNFYIFDKPDDISSFGLDVGVSGTLNFAAGDGEWTNYFDSLSGAGGPFAGGLFGPQVEPPTSMMRAMPAYNSVSAMACLDAVIRAQNTITTEIKARSEN